MRILLLALFFTVCVAATKPKPVAQKSAGELLVTQKCVSCHAVKIVTAKRRSPIDWEAMLDKMVDRGAPVSDAEYDVILAYLSAKYGLKK
jgi:mono/diheme cytochrome c family protein